MDDRLLHLVCALVIPIPLPRSPRPAIRLRESMELRESSRMVWLEEEREKAAAVDRPEVERPEVDPLREVGYEECEQWEEVIEVMVEDEWMRGLDSNVGEGWGELKEVLDRLVEREVEREVDGDLSLLRV
ncbi:hypothetical protein BOTCAL_0124g00030 [Botryotinia calthae]|uniref:Uncharacterized protein n=1 Tax=Botryotinia calthae TaxID=38488 RepID=A0A4Y8D6K1_9HELO|nr:hypothetical protein BOTCAL_0124g00030 [Botryotinia calthae]